MLKYFVIELIYEKLLLLFDHARMINFGILCQIFLIAYSETSGPSNALKIWVSHSQTIALAFAVVSANLLATWKWFYLLLVSQWRSHYEIYITL